MSLTAEQLEVRRSGITATDATGISGMNRFFDPVAVYLSKVDPEKMAERKAENPEQKSLGHRLEPMILDMLGEKYSLDLGTCGTIRSTSHAWALATPDRLVMANTPLGMGATVGVAEAKNVGLRMIADWRDGNAEDGDYQDYEEFFPPDYVQVQVAWQMLVTKTRVAYVGALLGGRDFRAWTIYQDDTLAETLLNVCGDFWTKHVLLRVPPAPAATKRAGDAIAAMFPSATKTVIEAPGVAEAWAAQYIDAKAMEKYYEGLRIGAENQLKMLVGMNAGMASRDWKLSWKNTASGGPDWQGLARALAGPGGIPADLMKTFTRGGYRRFLMTPSKARKQLAEAATGPANGTQADADTDVVKDFPVVMPLGLED